MATTVPKRAGRDGGEPQRRHRALIDTLGATGWQLRSHRVGSGRLPSTRPGAHRIAETLTQPNSAEAARGVPKPKVAGSTPVVRLGEGPA
jgi:hypothetical protein